MSLETIALHLVGLAVAFALGVFVEDVTTSLHERERLDE